MADEQFRLPGSSYDELCKIIKAYGHSAAPSPPGDVAKLAGVHSTIVSRNNAFLVGAGIVDGGNKKAVTPIGRELAQALEHDIADDVARHWRAVVDQTEFLERLITSVRIRNGMEPAALQTHVAYSAGQPRKPAVMTGASTVVEILKASGLLGEKDGKLVVQDTPTGEGRAVAEPDVTAIKPESKSDVSVKGQHPRAEAIPQPGLTFSVQVRVSVDCSVDELPQLAKNLKVLLREASPGAEVHLTSLYE